MSFMRPMVIISLLLLLMVILAGCGQKVPTKNYTSSKTTPTARGTMGPAVQTTVVPTTTSPFIEATLIPTGTGTQAPVPTYRNPPPVANITANLTVIDDKTMVFVYNRTAYTYSLENPPLVIDYTLTVPTVTRTRVIPDPVSGSDTTVTITYPDPIANFEVKVTDLETKRIIAREGYGGQYAVDPSNRLWIRYPGSYYIEFSGNRVTAYVQFLATKEA